MDLYRKVYIRSEADLPKEAGFYFIHWKHKTDRMHTNMRTIAYHLILETPLIN